MPMKEETIPLANGRDVPKRCVDALDAFEQVWPGATFHYARAVDVVIKAYEEGK